MVSSGREVKARAELKRRVCLRDQRLALGIISLFCIFVHAGFYAILYEMSVRAAPLKLFPVIIVIQLLPAQTYPTQIQSSWFPHCKSQTCVPNILLAKAEDYHARDQASVVGLPVVVQ